MQQLKHFSALTPVLCYAVAVCKVMTNLEEQRTLSIINILLSCHMKQFNLGTGLQVEGS